MIGLKDFDLERQGQTRLKPQIPHPATDQNLPIGKNGIHDLRLQSRETLNAKNVN